MKVLDEGSRPLCAMRRALLGMVLAALLSPTLAVANPADSTVSASGDVLNNAFYTDRPIEPTWLTPTPSYWCSNYTRIHYLDEIQWSAWGGDTATGTAIAGQGCEKWDASAGTGTPIGPPEGSPVTITLGGKQECAGFSIYTTYRLSLAPGVSPPAIWSHVKSGSFPCSAAAPGCTAYLIPGRFEPKGPSDCALRLKNLVGRKTKAAKWKPRTPPGQIVQLRRLLAAKWKNWGSKSAVGRGAMLDQHKIGRGQETDLLWAAEVELADPIWCPRLGEQGLQGSYGNPIAYTSLSLTLYGDGVKEKGHQPRSYYDRLMVKVRNMVGKIGLRKRVFTQRATVTTETCGR
jgi:hypothetical protein